jgi:hypothetical protein
LSTLSRLSFKVVAVHREVESGSKTAVYASIVKVGAEGDLNLRKLQVRTGLARTALEMRLASDVYSFKSARTAQAEAQSPNSKRQSSFTSVPFFSRARRSDSGPTGAPTVTAPAGVMSEEEDLGVVSREELMSAAYNLLACVGVPLSMDKKDLVGVIAELGDEKKRMTKAIEKERSEVMRSKAALAAMRQAQCCQICLTNEVSHVMTPCGHTVCEECSKKTGRKCPFCRASCSVHKFYLSQS